MLLLQRVLANAGTHVSAHTSVLRQRKTLALSEYAKCLEDLYEHSISYSSPFIKPFPPRHFDLAMSDRLYEALSARNHAAQVGGNGGTTGRANRRHMRSNPLL